MKAKTDNSEIMSGELAGTAVKSTVTLIQGI
jgi:hypothetical protein